MAVTGFIGLSKPVDHSFIDYNASSVLGAQSVTIAVPFGAADPKRTLLVGVSSAVNGAPSATVSSVSIGGISAERAVTSSIAIDAFVTVHDEIWAANVPNGTSGNVVITITNVPVSFSAAAFVYRALNVRRTTPTDTGVGTSLTSINIKKNGVAVGISRRSTTTSWAGLLEDNEQGPGLSVASLFSSTGATGLSVSTSGGSATALAVASFR